MKLETTGHPEQATDDERKNFIERKCTPNNKNAKHLTKQGPIYSQHGSEEGIQGPDPYGHCNNGKCKSGESLYQPSDQCAQSCNYIGVNAHAVSCSRVRALSE